MRLTGTGREVSGVSIVEQSVADAERPQRAVIIVWVRQDRIGFVVVLRVQYECYGQLPYIAQAGGLPRFLPGLSEDREENRGDDRDNRDYYEQLDQRESSASHCTLLVRVSMRPSTR